MYKSLQFLDSILHPYHDGKVKFILTGSAGDYNITFKGCEDHTNQLSHARKSWRYSFMAKEGEYVYFSAQANEPGSKVHVKILYNGRVFKESEAAGDFALAYAGGCLC